MIFLFVMPMWRASRTTSCRCRSAPPDMAFPRINALSFWMVPLGGLLLPRGFLTRRRGGRGLDEYAPLSEASRAGGTGMDLWLGGARSCIGDSSILGAINFLATIFKMRAPGHDADAHADLRLDRAGHERAAALRRAGADGAA